MMRFEPGTVMDRATPAQRRAWYRAAVVLLHASVSNYWHFANPNASDHVGELLRGQHLGLFQRPPYGLAMELREPNE